MPKVGSTRPKRISTATLSDIMSLDCLPSYDICYCDPPWEDRMVQFFQTRMKYQTGRTVDHDLESILKKLASLCETTKPVFVEYSAKGSDYVVSIMQGAGHRHFQRIQGIQTNGRPYVVLSFNTDVKMKHGLKGNKIIGEVLKNTQAKIVVDPFAGVGFTAKAVIAAGCTYLGIEINPTKYTQLKRVLRRCQK